MAPGLGKAGQAKVGYVLDEYKKGNLHSGPGKKHKAKSFKQALAIALSEGRRVERG